MSIQDPVGVAILTWNSEACIVSCLDSLQGQPISEIVVVDNASTDHTIELVQSHPLSIKLICEPTNTGFAAASNRALEALNTRFKLCLNDDAPEPQLLSILVEALNVTPMQRVRLANWFMNSALKERSIPLALRWCIQRYHP